VKSYRNRLIYTCSVGAVYAPGAESRRRERRPRRGGECRTEGRPRLEDPRGRAGWGRLRDRAPGAEGEYTTPKRCPNQSEAIPDLPKLVSLACAAGAWITPVVSMVEEISDQRLNRS